MGIFDELGGRLEAFVDETFLPDDENGLNEAQRLKAEFMNTPHNVPRVIDQNIEDVKETIEAIAESCETMQDFYDRCDSLFDDVDQNGTKQFVILSTVHKAKGLEWDRVFILRSTLYCNGNRRDDPEERNIHYVAVTRSKSALMMVGGDGDEGDEDDDAAR